MTNSASMRDERINNHNNNARRPFAGRADGCDASGCGVSVGLRGHDALRILSVIAFLSLAAPVSRGVPNLVSDGGFEAVRSVRLADNPYMRKLVESGCSFGSGKDFAVVPGNFSQGCGVFDMEMIEGGPEAEVHSGKRALRLRKGGFYLDEAFKGAYAAHEGDILKARYFVKGSGKCQINYALYGEGAKNCVQLSKKGTLSPDAWTEQEETCLLTGAGVVAIFPRISAEGDVSIDDLTIEKTVSQAAQPLPRKVAPYEFSKATCAFPAVKPPVVDGKLDDPCWKDVPAAGAFLTYGDERSEAAPPTTFKAVFDKEAIYLAITCSEPGMAGLITTAQGVDTGVEQYVGTHSLEIFIDPGRTRFHYFQFVVSATGALYDGEGKDSKWHAQWQARLAVGADGWDVEMAIPFSSLAAPAPRIGEAWGLNICRNRGPFDSNATWCPVGQLFHNPSMFGTLVFGSYQQWYDEVFVKERQSLERNLSGAPGMAERLERLESFAVRLDEAVKKDGMPKDWRGFSRLHYQAAFVTEALADYERYQAWLAIVEGKGSSGGNAE